MVDFWYGTQKKCQLLKVSLVLPPLEKILRTPMPVCVGFVRYNYYMLLGVRVMTRCHKQLL